MAHSPGNRNFSPGIVHQLHKMRKTRVDKAAIVNRDRIRRRHAEYEKAHGDAVIHGGGNRAAARGRCASAVDDQIVALNLDADARRFKAVGHHRQPVAFLDPQFAQSTHARRAGRTGGGDGQNRVFVDHTRRALRRDVDAAQCRGAHLDRGARFAGDTGGRGKRQIRAHFLQGREQSGTARIHADLMQRQCRAGAEQGGDHGKSR